MPGSVISGRFPPRFTMAQQSVDAPVYDASSIQVLEGLSAVRRRPGMYIGSTDARGLHHLVYEVVDNSIDEVLAGACDEIVVTLQSDGSCSVRDNGRGIPVENHPKYNRPALEIVMTVLHAGSKFDRNTYKVSGGLHGVGVHVVNALSEWLEVRVSRDGKEYFQRYEHGAPVAPLKVVGKSESTGTDVRFKPDSTVLETSTFDKETVGRRLKELSFLNPSVTIRFKDERDGSAATYHHAGGITEFVEDLNKGSNVLFQPPISLHAKRDTTDIELALQYNDGYNETGYAFVNNINTVDGGTHVMGLRSALTRTLNDYARKRGFVKGDKEGLTGEDVREGLTSVLSVKVLEPQFEGPARELGSEGPGRDGRQREARRVPRGTSVGRPGTDLEGRPGLAGPGGRAQGPRAHPSQGAARGRRTTGEARRLSLPRPRGVRALPRGGGQRRRDREAGPGPGVPGGPPAPRKDPERREGPPRQDARERRDPGADHGDRDRDRRRAGPHAPTLPQDDPDDGCGRR